MKGHRKFRLGTRRSQLATTQSNYIQNLLLQNGVECELVLIESDGDTNLKVPLYEIESATPGLFTKRLERALLDNEVDLAVHSLKDLPVDCPNGLRLGAIPVREDAGDCLLIHPAHRDTNLPLGLGQGLTLGTSSLRREAQFASRRPDLKLTPIRGNVPTRMKLVADGVVHSTVLARAGLARLGLPLTGVVRSDLPIGEFVPAPGQGALAVEIRTDAARELTEALEAIHHEPTARATSVERRVLKGLMGGCTLPLGVYCEPDPISNDMKLKAFLGLLETRGAKIRQWISFHHFDFSSPDDDTLVDKTVQFFKDVMSATQ